VVSGLHFLFFWAAARSNLTFSKFSSIRQAEATIHIIIFFILYSASSGVPYGPPTRRAWCFHQVQTA
jgi:hypothetical protein